MTYVNMADDVLGFLADKVLFLGFVVLVSFFVMIAPIITSLKSQSRQRYYLCSPSLNTFLFWLLHNQWFFSRGLFLTFL